MIRAFILSHPYWSLAVVTLLANIPLGYERETSQKFSAQWFLWIHASIPLIIYLRLKLGTSSLFIPACIFVAVAGQIAGGWCRKRELTIDDIEQYDRLPDLHIPGPEKTAGIKDTQVAVVLLNMGGPQANEDVPDFQKRLFRDPLLIRFPLSKILQPVFAQLIVKFRGKKAQQRYQLIGGGSPIYESTKKQAAALKNELIRRNRYSDVTFAFNYSQPFPLETIERIAESGREYILPVSLYPHYSRATTGSSLHYLKKAARQVAPELKFLESPSYYLHDAYLTALTDRIKETLNPGESLEDFYIIFSAHGIPLYLFSEGDPYPFQIAQTVGGILQKLKRNHDWVISYQSAVGPLQWIKPSTESILKALGRRGKRKVLVVPVSFVTDHIETLHEIDIKYRAFAQQQGIEDFRMSKALECHPGFIYALADSVETFLPQNYIRENTLL